VGCHLGLIFDRSFGNDGQRLLITDGKFCYTVCDIVGNCGIKRVNTLVNGGVPFPGCFVTVFDKNVFALFSGSMCRGLKYSIIE
jgi:hypothetical protein